MRINPNSNPNLNPKNTSFIRPFLLLLSGMLVLSMVACGFQLRGPHPLPFHSIYLQMNQYSDMAASLKRQITSNGGTIVVDSPDKAEVTLIVVNDSREKEILSLNSAGTVSEYQLREHFTFKLVDKAGLEVMPLNDIYVFRDQSYDDSQALAKEQEETMFYRDMQNDIIQQLLRRLSAAKLTTTAGSEPVTPAVKLN